MNDTPAQRKHMDLTLDPESLKPHTFRLELDAFKRIQIHHAGTVIETTPERIMAMLHYLLAVTRPDNATD